MGTASTAWQGSDRRTRLPANWTKIRARILKRDGYVCTEVFDNGDKVKCTEPATDVDHIRPGDDHSDKNLRSLCDWHHRRKSSHEGGTAYGAVLKRNAGRYKRVEAHPGLL